MAVDRRVQFVIEKLVDELNAQIEEGGDLINMYSEEVEEINEAIKDIGLDAQIKE